MTIKRPLTLALALFIFATTAAASSCDTTGSNEVNAPATSQSSGATGTTSSAKPVAHVGSTLNLSGEDITLSKVIDPAAGADEFSSPDPGKRFIAVVFLIKNGGSSALQDDANNDVAVIGSDSQNYSPDFDSVSECTNFNSGAINLGPGESVSGCVVFQLPKAVKVAKVQWTGNSGLSSTFGEWLVP
jgi:hypothetical protein